MGFLRMAIKTTLEQLEAVQAAIAFCEAGQEGSVNGKRYRMADLAVLYRREEQLLARYHREQAGSAGPASTYGIPRRD